MNTQHSNNLEKETSWLLHEKYKGKRTKKFKQDISRLLSGEPLDYIIGNTPFLGCTIDLSYRPLIPRTETEFWVEKAIHKVKKESHSSVLKILDLFAGSGCIGISLLTHLPLSYVDFGEKDSNLVLQISKNIKTNIIDSTRTHIYKTDCFSNIPKDAQYDYIFANPPYISNTRTEHIQASVLNNEPHKALFAPDNGLFFIKKLITVSPQFLKKGGTLYIEFDTFQKETIEQYIPTDIYTMSFWKDQFEQWRVVRLTKK